MTTDNPKEPASLVQLLDGIDDVASDRDSVSLEEMMEAVGRRSFGPVVLLVGIILVTPLSGLPGIPTLMGLLTLLTVGQMLLGLKRFWLPQWIVQRSISRQGLKRGLRWLRPSASRVDRLTRPRFTLMVDGPGLYLIAVGCLLISLVMPATELVPFSASIAGLALAAFGLAMMSRDGVLALFAWAVSLAGPLWLIRNLSQ